VILKMAEHQILSLPLYSGDTPTDYELKGRVSLFEIMQYFYRPDQTKQFRLDKPISKVLKFSEFYLQKIHPGFEFGFPFVLSKKLSHSLTLDSLFYPFSAGLHRLLVEIEYKEYINISQSDVVRFLLQNSLLTKYADTKIGTGAFLADIKDVIVFQEGYNVVRSFARLAECYQTAAAVVDEDGSLITTLSSTDLRGLTPELLPRMKYMSIREFLLFYRKDRGLRPPIVVREDDDLLEAMWKMVHFKVHRVWLVDDYVSKKPFGVVSFSHIFRILSGYEKKFELFEKLSPKVEFQKPEVSTGEKIEPVAECTPASEVNV